MKLDQIAKRFRIDKPEAFKLAEHDPDDTAGLSVDKGEAKDLLKGAGARRITLICIVAAPEGVAAVERAHPDVPIVTPVVDRELNARKFIVPGLGDFGDRLYGTT